ncbi:MAG: hypothetical protein R2797_08755 [Gelidibacter sp.]
MSDNLEPIDDDLEKNLPNQNEDDDNDDDDFDDDDYDDYEEWETDENDFKLGEFGVMMGMNLGSNVKEYLAEYYGEDVMANLEPETYLEIEKIIKDYFYYECMDIPDILYNNRSITHEELEAYEEAYVYTPKSFDWPKRTGEWFERDFSEYNDDDENEDLETYLKESDPIDLTEDEKKIRKVIEAADNLIDGHAAFADFTKRGYQKLSVEFLQYLDKRLALDLEVTTEEGFKKIEETVYFLITEMLNELYGAVNYDLKNKS